MESDNDYMLQKEHVSKKDQTLEAPPVPKGKRAKRLPKIKGFTGKQAGDALAMR
jgi:hypothetical protein